MAHLRTQFEAGITSAQSLLTELVASPTISADPNRLTDLGELAELLVERSQALGAEQAMVVQAGGHPAVIARWPAPNGQPTVCLYSHYDVQPVGDPAEWSSPPFEATQRGDRLYGRGTADDKGGVAVHFAALEAFGAQPPVGITLLLEGEEEIGSPSLGAILAEYQQLLTADVYVIADSINWAVDSPALTTSLRGLADCVVEVSTLDHNLHSGQFGGPVPDALTCLCRLLATLHDDQGNVAVAGLDTAPPPEVDYDADQFRAEAGMLAGVEFTGTGSLAERLWCRPAVSVLGIDAPPTAAAPNALVAQAKAKVSLRVAPGQQAQQYLDALSAHLTSHAPWGAQVKVIPGDLAQPSVSSCSPRVLSAISSAIEQAWGKPPVSIGAGGSVPLVAEFQRLFPQSDVLITAVADPQSRIHSTDESLHLEDWQKAAWAETVFLALLGESATDN